eukprot:4532428-Prymnesium_polylepis.1
MCIGLTTNKRAEICVLKRQPVLLTPVGKERCGTGHVHSVHEGIPPAYCVKIAVEAASQRHEYVLFVG